MVMIMASNKHSFPDGAKTNSRSKAHQHFKRFLPPNQQLNKSSFFLALN